MKSRIFYTDMWRDDTFVRLSGSAKLLSIYLLANDAVRNIKCYKLRERTITFDLGLTSVEIKELKDELQKAGLFAFLNDWIFINNEHSYCDYKNVRYTPSRLKELAKVPEDFIKYIDHVMPNHWPIAEDINYKDTNDKEKSTTCKVDEKNNKSEGESIENILG